MQTWSVDLLMQICSMIIVTHQLMKDKVCIPQLLMNSITYLYGLIENPYKIEQRELTIHLLVCVQFLYCSVETQTQSIWQILSILYKKAQVPVQIMDVDKFLQGTRLTQKMVNRLKEGDEELKEQHGYSLHQMKYVAQNMTFKINKKTTTTTTV